MKNTTEPNGFNLGFCKSGTFQAREEITSDLKKIVKVITYEVPKATLVLAGSLFYGEEAFREEKNSYKLLSDYDIYVIIPSFWETISVLRNKRLQNLSRNLGLATSLELVIIWKRLLTWGLTSVQGRILAGDDNLKKLMDRAPIPPPTNNLKKAYQSLIMMLFYKERRDVLLRSAVIRAFRAYLLAKEKHVSSHTWRNYFSLRFDLKILEKHRSFIGEAVSRMIEDAILDKLYPQRKKLRGDIHEFVVIRDFMNRLLSEMPSSFRVQDYLQYILFQLGQWKLPNPLINVTTTYLQAARYLTESVIDNQTFDTEKLQRASKLIERIGLQKQTSVNAMDRFLWCAKKIEYFGNMHPHKVT